MLQRNTKQKKIIMDALMCADHPTATELYEIVHRDNPSISRGTVFRVLSQFAESGAVNKLSFPDCSTRFDATVTPHAHAHCVYCGRVFDITDDDIAAICGRRSLGGFEVFSVSVDFACRCPECAKSQKN